MSSSCPNTSTRVMLERSDCCSSKSTRRTRASMEVDKLPAKVVPYAFPLDSFYARAGLPLPKLEPVDPAKMPEPYRSLLVHNNDMTPTLSAFHARIIHLRVLSREHRDGYYFREVVLVADGSNQPGEFGG